MSITTTDTEYLQNIQVLNGTEGGEILENIAMASAPFTTTIGKNSSGEIISRILMDF